MPLTPAQLTTLKAHILANTNTISSGQFAGQTVQAVATANPRGGDHAFAIAQWYNLSAAGPFVVWRNRVDTTEIGKTVNYVAVEAMTTANQDRIKTFYTMNPSNFRPTADIRTYWENTMSGALGGQGQASRDALLALWKRNATNAEKVFATGTGTALSPADLGFEGSVTPSEIDTALNLP